MSGGGIPARALAAASAPAPRPASAAVSRELAGLGPYFAVEFHPASQEPESPWQSLGELIGNPEAMGERVAGVRSFLAAGTRQDAEAVELRVAASVVHLGLAARLLSPVFALGVRYGWRGSVRAAELWWQPGPASTFPLSIDASVFDDGRSDHGFFAEGVVPELETVMRAIGVNQRILRGNVASALVGAGRTLSAARSDLAGRAARELEVLLAGPYLAGSAGHAPDGSFRRRSCCLIYRAAPDRDGALCGDCVLLGRSG